MRSPDERLDRADGGGDGEKGADLRSILGVKLIRLGGGIGSGGAEGVGGVECSQILSDCLLVSLAQSRKFCTILLGSSSVGEICRAALGPWGGGGWVGGSS